jgi:hypothetical protein
MKRSCLVLAVIAVLALIPAACSDDSPARHVATPTVTAVPSDTSGTVGIPAATAATAVGLVSGVTGTCPLITFKLGTTTIVANAQTTFRLGCGDIKEGVRITVAGVRQADGSVVAHGIASAPVAEPRPDPGTGPVSRVGEVSVVAGTCPALSFTVGTDAKLYTNASTKFHVACAEIKIGMTVGVKAVRQSDARWLVLEIAEPPVLSRPRTVSGVVSGFVKTTCPAVTFTINDRKIVTSAKTTFEGKACRDIVDGDTAVAAGIVGAEGTLLAAGVKTRK